MKGSIFMILTINSKTFKVIDYINIKHPDETPSAITLPLLDIPQLSDREWQVLCQSRKVVAV